MSPLIKGLVYFVDLLLIIATFFAIYRYKILDLASRIFAVYLCLSVVSETVGYYFIIRYRNNLPVYGIDAILEFGLTSLYFNYCIDAFRRRRVGYYIAAFGMSVGIANLLFVQGLNTLNSYFLVFEGICIIAMALFFFFRLLLRYDDLKLQLYAHFWLATILAFFWSSTFVNWSLYNYFSARLPSKLWVVEMSRLLACVVTYFGVCCVFIMYPKMHKQPL